MRIVGGIFRSRALVAPKGQDTRPTSDRVREALFSMLASDGLFDIDPDVAYDLRVLDLFAGSGALGFEALSRGATAVTFVEAAKPATFAIRENIRALDVESQVTLLAMRVDRALEKIQGPFELIVIDPPYADVRNPSFAATILASAGRHLAASGVLVLEHASSDEVVPPADLVLDRSRRHGDTTISLFRRATS